MKLRKSLLWALLTILLALGAGLWTGMTLMLEDTARLDLPKDLSRRGDSLPAHLRNKLLGETPQQGKVKRLILNAEDLNAICRSSLKRRKLEGQCRFNLSGETLIGEISLRLQGPLSDRYLNIDLLAQGRSETGFSVPYLRIGAVRITSALGLGLIRLAVLASPLRRYEYLRNRMVEDIHIREGRLVIVLNWDRQQLLTVRDIAPEAADLARVEIYVNALKSSLTDLPKGRFVRLGTLTQALFSLAKARSNQMGRPIEENKAVILVLSAFANGKDLTPFTATPIELPHREVLLNQRADTARHFLASALLVMSGQSTLVEMIGLAKELQDSHDGSGFSFVDLAADEAGAGFGRIATSSTSQATRVQSLLAESPDEGRYIPKIRDLPESIRSKEFEDRFQSIGSPLYEELRREIRHRIQALPIYH